MPQAVTGRLYCRSVRRLGTAARQRRSGLHLREAMSQTDSQSAPSARTSACPAAEDGDDGSDVGAARAAVERFFRALRAGTSARWLEIDLTLSQLKVMFTL